MEVTIKIEGLDQLTEAVAMLGGAMAYFKGVSADDAVKSVEEVTTKMEERLRKVKENSAKVKENSAKEEEISAKEEAAPVYTLEALQAAAVELARNGKRDDLAAALAECGAETLPKLAEDQFNVFAEKLKALGANL